MFDGSSLGPARVPAVLRVASLALLACTLGCGGREEVRLGAVYPLTGETVAAGADARRGIELAVEIVNGEFDLDLPLARSRGLLDGARLRVVFGDHADQPELAVSESRRLVEEAGAVALLGAYTSRETAAASEWAEERGVPFLAPDSTAPTLTERGLRWFFRTTADDRVFVANFFKFLDQLAEGGIGLGSVAVVYEDSLFGSSVGALQIEAAAAAGLPVVAEVSYSAVSEDLDDEIAQVVAAGADMVMQTSYARDAIRFMQGYRALGYRPDALLAMDAGFTSPAFVQALGPDADFVISREVWAPDLAEGDALIAEVRELFRQRFGVEMTGGSARAFTGLLVLADALDRAGTREPVDVRAALRATELGPDQLIVPWDGVRFDPVTGQNVLADGIIVQILDGQYRTIWPPELATREVVWPMPPWDP